PVGEVEIRIVGAGDPRLAAGTHQVRLRSPRFAARLALMRDRVELPRQLAGRDVDGADPAAVAGEALAAAQPLQHVALDRDRSAGGEVAFLGIADAGFPEQPPGPRVDRHHARVAAGKQNLVLRDREAARSALTRPLFGAGALFPDQRARPA